MKFFIEVASRDHTAAVCSTSDNAATKSCVELAAPVTAMTLVSATVIAIIASRLRRCVETAPTMSLPSPTSLGADTDNKPELHQGRYQEQEPSTPTQALSSIKTGDWVRPGFNYLFIVRLAAQTQDPAEAIEVLWTVPDLLWDQRERLRRVVIEHLLGRSPANLSTTPVSLAYAIASVRDFTDTERLELTTLTELTPRSSTVLT